jgi:hypothetical protein
VAVHWGGVYVLWRGEALLFIGSAPDAGHSIKGERGACPKQRELELLKEYAERHRSYPRCNEET